MPILVYLLLCLIAALLARETRFGFAGTFVLALVLTPLPVLLGLLCFAPRPPPVAPPAPPRG